MLRCKDIDFTSTVPEIAGGNFTQKLPSKDCVINFDPNNFTANFSVDVLVVESAIFAIEQQLQIDEMRNHDIDVQVYVAFTFFSVICIPLDYFAAKLIFSDVLVPLFSENLVINYVNL